MVLPERLNTKNAPGFGEFQILIEFELKKTVCFLKHITQPNEMKSFCFLSLGLQKKLFKS